MDDHEDIETAGQKLDPGSNPQDPPRVGQSDAEGPSQGDRSGRPTSSGTSGGDLQGGVRQVPTEAGHHLRGRHPQGISVQEDVETFRSQLTVAFNEGNPEKAWEVSQRLLDFASDLVIESAKYRFKLNFGTDLCRTCTGLKAGPGVAATCYQVQQCTYSHIRADALNPRQARLVDLLGKKS